MIDLETLGVVPGCAVLQIGAVCFDPHGDELGETFSANLDVTSQTQIGMHREKSTEEWWSVQPKELRARLAQNQIIPTKAADMLESWFARNKVEFVWSHGAAFDLPILTVLFHKLKKRVFWSFWKIRDTRTLYDLAGFDPRAMQRDGTAHDALDDAIFQARCVQAAHARLAGRSVSQPEPEPNGCF